MRKYIFILLGVVFALLPTTELCAIEISKSDANIIGHVIDKNTKEHVSYVTVALKGTTLGTVTDATGHYFLKNLPEGSYTLEISMMGYRTESRKVTAKKGITMEMNFQIEEDAISLEGVVVSANRNETTRRVAPTLVKVISPKMFETTNSQTLSQGLCFLPGVRVENDCQNCGYTQVRINGMDGKYTQILIDSRPVFSSLAGVYGLEQIPANMIERVEVVRGGGSALFGSSAIAGTVNIITREPIRNSGVFSHTITNLNGSGSFDNNTTLNLSLVSENNKMGAYIYGQNRQRKEWDYNGDGFSELPKLKSQTFGTNAFYKTGTYSKLNLEYHHIEEFRRGGNRQDLAPHIAEDAELNGMGKTGLVEQIEHSINTGSVKFTVFTPGQKQTFNIYASAQNIERKTYYSAYGQTSDFTGVTGGQYVYSFDKFIFMPADLTGGIEFSHDNLKDKGTDIQKYKSAALKANPNATGTELQTLITQYTPDPMNQIINVGSAYLQNEWKNERWSFLLGGRIDKNSVIDHAIFSPRANIRFNPTKDINLRLSYAEGFRAPQAFDEDLHISTIGGELTSIVRAKGLKEERSRSLNASVDWYLSMEDWQINLLMEGFYTKLTNPFVLSAPVEDPNRKNYLVMTRSNGSGAKVYGATLEGKIAWLNKIQVQGGATLQSSRYDSPEEWSADKEHLSEKERISKYIMRTPDFYGYFTASYMPSKAFTIAVNGSYTGKMYIPHLLSKVDGTTDVLIKSPDFFELGTKLTYDVALNYGLNLQLNAGIQNIFNSYQTDFDKGSTRDSGYIYGPGSPRSYYAGVKLSF